MLAKQVYEGDGGYIVVQLITRSSPKVDGLRQGRRSRSSRSSARARAQAFLEDWLKERCEKLVKDGKITPNPGSSARPTTRASRCRVTYQPCMSFQLR